MKREEAIKILKELHDGALFSVRNALEMLIPELAESEDENLKNKSGYYKGGKFWKASTLWNATKDKIPQRVPNRYILQECTWNIGTLQQFANEIKNVQEVSLDYPIILDTNGYILDGAHRIVKAYLEGKDIDVVYLGDDEWPEPDYDEEKAVKESEDERIRLDIVALINFALEDGSVVSSGARTTKEEALRYLEKQKEQKPTPVWMPKFLDELRSKKNYFDWDEHKDIEGYILAIINWIAPDYFDRKDKGQKPAEWSEGDKKMLSSSIEYVLAYPAHRQSVVNWLKSLPKRFNIQTYEKSVEWSEEDKDTYKSVYAFFEQAVDKWYDVVFEGCYPKITREKILSMLKSLRPQPHWKPSEKDASA